MKHRKKETMSDEPLKIFKGGLTLESLDSIERIVSRSIERHAHLLCHEEDEEDIKYKEAIADLAADIRENVTIRDIIDFNSYAQFTRYKYDVGTDWVSNDRRITGAGYVADTAEKQRDIIALFDRLEKEAYFFIGMKMYAEKSATPPPILWDKIDEDDDERSPLDMTLNALIHSNPAVEERSLIILKGMETRLAKKLEESKALIQAQGADISATRTDVAYLAKYRKDQTEKNRKRGAENQAKGNNEEQKRAAADMDAALDRVRRKVKDMEKDGERANVLQVCRAVCKEFKWKSSAKNALNKCATGYYPLTGADDKPIEPETLAKNYRERYGTKKKKAVAAK